MSEQQTIVRVSRHHERFTVLGNDMLRDARLSFRARGVLGYMLSLPGDWSVSSVNLAAAGTEGRDAIRAALRELEEVGHVLRRRERGEGGTLRTVTYVREDVSVDWPTGAWNPVSGVTREDDANAHVTPGTGKPDDGGPGAIRSTDNEEPKTKNSARRRSSPEADAITRAWWESKNPRPIARGGFVAIRGLVQTGLDAGGEADAIRSALDECYKSGFYNAAGMQRGLAAWNARTRGRGMTYEEAERRRREHYEREGSTA